MTIADTPQRAQRGATASPHLRWRVGLHPLIWLYLLSVIIPLGVNVGPLFLTGLRFLLLILITPMMVRLFSGDYGKTYATDYLFVGYLVFATVSLLVNNPETVIQQTGSTGIEFLGGYALGRAYIRDQADFRALSVALVLLVLFMAPFAVYETSTGRSPVIASFQMLPVLRTVAEVPAGPRELFGVSLERVQLGFSHPIHFGLFCSVAFSLCFVGLSDSLATASRWILSTTIAATGFLALSSGAILAIGLQIGLIAWAICLARYQRRWWVLLALCCAAYATVDVLSNRTPIHVFMSYATFSPHTAYWRAITFEWGMTNVWMHPVFGLGFHDWVRPDFMYSDSIDNFWLLTAMRYGLPAFVCLALGYGLAIANIIRRDLGNDAVLNNQRLAWVITFVGLSFTLATVHVWTAIYSFTFFLLGAGVWLNEARPEATSRSEKTARPNERLAHTRNLADRDSEHSKRHRFTRF